MENFHNSKENTRLMQILGIGLVRISENNINESFKVLFQKGIGIPLVQNIMELYKKEIISKKQGNSIIPLNDMTIFLHYFEHSNHDILVIIYMEKKENSVNFSQLYFLSKDINKKFQSHESLNNIIYEFNSAIEIPKTEGVIAIFIIGSTGSPFVSMINKKRSNIQDHEVHIGGFISALLSFSNTIIGEETGAKLKEINFGNQQFYVITKNHVIFAFLVEKMNFLIQRYMYLLADEFLFSYKDLLKNFNGDITPFSNFEEIINQYFII
ncbi:MAG: hypothetical protein ACFFB0_14345 [Promethearchaeota archaeon]